MFRDLSWPAVTTLEPKQHMEAARVRTALLNLARECTREAMVVLGSAQRGGSTAAAILGQALQLAGHRDATTVSSEARARSTRLMIQRAMTEGLLDGTLVRDRANRNLIRLSCH